MKRNRIVIVSGPPGSGKSSVSKELAENSVADQAVHMHTDDFYHSVRKGYVFPWLPEAQEQNRVIIEAFAAGVTKLAANGYEVMVDGVIGPWFLEPWLDLTANGFDVRYVILRPDIQTTVKRAVNRSDESALTDVQAVERMWHSFAQLGVYESHVVDTTGQSIDETVIRVQTLLRDGALRLG